LSQEFATEFDDKGTPLETRERGCVVLSPDEEKVFDEIQRQHTERGERLRPPRRRQTPLAFVVLWWVSLFTVIVGATRPGLGMATAVGLGWLLWRYLPELGDILQAVSTASDGADNRAPRREREYATASPVSGHITVASGHSVMETAQQPPRGERS
jgi:hypothetical protein